MKRKLLVIGILALFVIFMMPMVSAAPPVDQRLRAIAYNLSDCDSARDGSAYCTGIFGKGGTVVVGSLYSAPGSSCPGGLEFDISYSFSKLRPNTQYAAAFVTPDGSGGAILSGSSDLMYAPFTTDEMGRLKGVVNTCGHTREALITKFSDKFVGIIPW